MFPWKLPQTQEPRIFLIQKLLDQDLLALYNDLSRVSVALTRGNRKFDIPAQDLLDAIIIFAPSIFFSTSQTEHDESDISIPLSPEFFSFEKSLFFVCGSTIISVVEGGILNKCIDIGLGLTQIQKLRLVPPSFCLGELGDANYSKEFRERVCKHYDWNEEQVKIVEYFVQASPILFKISLVTLVVGIKLYSPDNGISWTELDTTSTSDQIYLHFNVRMRMDIDEDQTSWVITLTLNTISVTLNTKPKETFKWPK